MAIDRETFESLYKKGKSNSTIAKELQIRRETVWKVTGLGQKENSSNQANG